jgi:hypothetical protein
MRTNVQIPPEGFAVKLALAVDDTQCADRDTDVLHTNLYRQV